VVRVIAAGLGVILLVVGVTLAENYRGSARRAGLWAIRTNNRVTNGRGPYRWRNEAFQTVAHRFYGGVAALLGFIILTIAVRH
jgi:hypothetical protein